MTSKLSYCGEVVKQHDPDRFLLSMLCPAAARAGLWALLAFNHEIAKTREVVSETQLGLIRLQWWREELDKIYSGAEIVPGGILPELAEAIRGHDLPRAHFDALLYAREFDLEDVLPGNLEGLMNYADFTATPLAKLCVQVLGGDAEEEPVQPIATSYALVGVLRSVLFHAKQRRCYLPEDLLKAHEVRTSQLYEFKPQKGLVEVIRGVSEVIITDAAPRSKVLKGLQGLTKIYVKQLAGCEYNVFNPKILMPPAFKEIRLIVSVM